MSIWTKEEEGEALRKRFDDLKRTHGVSRAKFAKDHGFNGGDSMIYQHITGHRPMSMEAAIAYAKAFSCELHEISPRLAEEAKQMAAAIWSDDGKTKQVVKQKDLPRATPHQHTKQRVKILDAAAPYIIPQYQAGGSMGHGLALPDQPGIIENWSVNREWLNKNVRHFTAAGNLCIVTGFGPSMQPMFNPGDPLLVDLGVTSVIADGVYFFRVGREGFIKQLQKIPTSTGTKYIAKSKNPDFDPFDITPDMDFEVIGRVVRIWCGTDF